MRWCLLFFLSTSLLAQDLTVSPQLPELLFKALENSLTADGCQQESQLLALGPDLDLSVYLQAWEGQKRERIGLIKKIQKKLQVPNPQIEATLINWLSYCGRRPSCTEAEKGIYLDWLAQHLNQKSL